MLGLRATKDIKSVSQAQSQIIFHIRYNMCQPGRTPEVPFKRAYDDLQEQFRYLGVEPYSKPQFLKVLQRQRFSQHFAINHQQQRIVIKTKYYKMGWEQFIVYLREQGCKGVCFEDQQLMFNPSLRDQIIRKVDQHKLRIVVLNNMRYVFPMDLELEADLVKPHGQNRNPEKYMKAGYLSLCREQFGGRGHQKDVEHHQKTKARQDTSRYNHNLPGYLELFAEWRKEEQTEKLKTHKKK